MTDKSEMYKSVMTDKYSEECRDHLLGELADNLREVEERVQRGRPPYSVHRAVWVLMMNSVALLEVTVGMAAKQENENG